MSSMAYYHAPTDRRLSAARLPVAVPRPSASSTAESPPTVVRIPTDGHGRSRGARPLERRIIDGESSAEVGRRQALRFGLSLGLGLVDPTVLLLRSRPYDAGAAEAAPPCELLLAASGLGFCDRTIGAGSEAAEGQLIKAHYVGKLENGKIFDSSYDRGKPLTFRVGVGEVIKGWDLGFLGGPGIPPMLPGGKRMLRVPPELGYGMRGAGCEGGSCIIPPNAVLVFDVEFIGKV